MGLLDDAIREHLDLKRRRGADPAEIERAEREALGPVRRGPEEAESEDLAGTAVAYDHQADEQEWEESFADESEPDIPDFLAERPRPLTFEDESADDQVAYDEPTAPESGGSRDLAGLDETHTAEDAGPAHETGEADLPGRGEPGMRAVPRPHPAPDAGVPSAADAAPDSSSPEPHARTATARTGVRVAAPRAGGAGSGSRSRRDGRVRRGARVPAGRRGSE